MSLRREIAVRIAAAFAEATGSLPLWIGEEYSERRDDLRAKLIDESFAWADEILSREP